MLDRGKIRDLNKGEFMFKMIGSCINKDLDIRCMIARCFYDTPNKASYDLTSGTVMVSGKVIEGWRVIIKGKRVRLEFRVG